MWLSLVRPLLETSPATQAFALIGNRTSDLLVCRPILSPLSQTSEGKVDYFFKFDFILLHVRDFPKKIYIYKALKC